MLADPSSKNCRDGVNLLGIRMVDQTGTCDRNQEMAVMMMIMLVLA